MSGMEEQLGAILSNPQMMQQLMSMAQTLGGQGPPPEPPREAPPEPAVDLAMVQKLSGLARKGTIDDRERSLLKALHPYLSSLRLEKLERAMRAAKMAQAASAVLGQGGLFSLGGGDGRL